MVVLGYLGRAVPEALERVLLGVLEEVLRVIHSRVF